MITYRILKVLFNLSSSFGFENSQYINFLLNNLRCTKFVQQIDYFYHVKFGILFKKLKQISHPDLDFNLTAPSLNKFQSIIEEDMFHNPNLKKIPPQNFYFFAAAELK